MSTSGKFTPHALTAISTWFFPGAGEGISRSSMSSGGPYCVQSKAFMTILPLASPRGVDHQKMNAGQLL
jgi:molybdopterin biosynthesis enzyme MoaB